MLWKQMLRFGDEEVARLIAPRRLIFDSGDAGVTGLTAALKAQPEAAIRWDRQINPDEISQIANAQFTQWQARFRNLAVEAYAARESAWQPDTTSAENYQRWEKPRLDGYFDTVGRYPDAAGPIEAKSVQIYDEPEFKGYRLSVKLYEDVHAYGILLVPKGMKAGERRPVVFTQHGLRGIPEHALGVVPDEKNDAVYARFGYRLAQRGYIVFAPMISTQTGTDRSSLTRRAHLLGLTPVGMELRKFSRVLDYLSTLDFVDKERFAFYGLSYGGYTALWIGPGEPRFKVVISSGHFNDWNLKTSDLTEGTSFLFHADHVDMFNFGLLKTLNHSDLAMLCAPRAYMIEVGDKDGVVMSPRRFVDVEMSRLKTCIGNWASPSVAASHALMARIGSMVPKPTHSWTAGSTGIRPTKIDLSIVIPPSPPETSCRIRMLPRGRTSNEYCPMYGDGFFAFGTSAQVEWPHAAGRIRSSLAPREFGIISQATHDAQKVDRGRFRVCYNLSQRAAPGRADLNHIRL